LTSSKGYCERWHKNNYEYKEELKVDFTKESQKLVSENFNVVLEE
jgi:hypothetical protein